MATLPPVATNIVNSGERQIRLAQLLKEAAEQQTTNPQQAERTLLTAAGYHVGMADWEAAKEIYEQLAANTTNADIKSTVARNLVVVNRDIAIAAETDDTRRERMQMDLASLHISLGHEQAAKKIWRDLSKSAAQEEVRLEAASRLAAILQSVLPAAPPATTR